MNIFVYTDESGVLDKVHEKFYVYGGVLFLEKEIRDIEHRKYINAERTLTNNRVEYNNMELKASFISNKDKGKLFRSLNSCIKFGVVINQKNLLDTIFKNKKTKQRYLDYAYKIGLKRILENLISSQVIESNNVKNIYIYADEHTTATDGLYELKEGLEQEFKYGTHNHHWNKFYPPIFNQLHSVEVKYRDSSNTPLIRAADIIANRIYYLANSGNLRDLNSKVFLTFLP